MQTPEKEEIARLESELKTIKRLIKKENTAADRHERKEYARLRSEIKLMHAETEKACKRFRTITKALVRQLSFRREVIHRRIAVLTGRAAK